MSKFIGNSTDNTARQGLYRVWVPLHDDGRAPLISIWIDPTMTAFELEQHHEDIGHSSISEGAISEEIEDLRRWDLYRNRLESESANGFMRSCKLTGLCTA